ncbi:MAG: undecaprenyl-diphosphate phosphatase [Peptostreptococcaceae bacterium]|nr:undecaprenyl-diphosphate phosphatase [Peptostreptococcaceae bacterium]
MIIKAIILGIIEGLTEFLPISSTGHLIIANRYLDFQGPFANTFDVVIQVGAIFAVILYFRKKLIPDFKDNDDMTRKIRLWSKVFVGVVPAVILGVMFEDIIDKYLFNTVTVAWALIVGAFLLLYFENRNHVVKIEEESELTYRQAFIVGSVQCFALIPGMSRSAATIVGGLGLGFGRKLAAEFSFFLAVPTLLGASFYKMIKSGLHINNEQWILLAVGTGISFIVAYVVIAAFMNYIKNHSFNLFAYYRIVLGILVLYVFK